MKLGQKFERFASRVLFDSFEFIAIVGWRVYGKTGPEQSSEYAFTQPI